MTRRSSKPPVRDSPPTAPASSSVRFICGTFDCHLALEEKTAEFLGTEAALSYTSCWNANEGLIPALAGPDDAIVSDEANHASTSIRSSIPKPVARCSDTATWSIWSKSWTTCAVPR